MKMDCYPRFKKSELAKQCLLAEVEGRPLPIDSAPEQKRTEPQYGVWKKQKVSKKEENAIHGNRPLDGMYAAQCHNYMHVLHV